MSQSQISDELSIAVIGMAGRFPGAADVDSLWRNVRDGVESISFFSDQELEASGMTPEALDDPAFVRAAGVLDDEDLFDAEFFGLNPREAEILDPQQRLLLESAWQALEDAGYDPESFDGTIGVFAGVGMNSYFLNNVLSHPEILRSTPPLQVMIGADKDYVAPQLSYKLNLKGPSVSVQSACSTSLVAVHLACQSLQDFQSDLVLAGGCSVRVPQRSGYWYQEGGIFSPDGHCRAFDAKAAGTVAGSGVGVVALRRLEDALDAGDRILAVIRGSAINNDGSAKVGFTAPGVEGQVTVVSEALAASGVEGESITYVEAHGTGTALGDPIEVSALAQAFEGDDRRGACALGSLKSNVGHLDTAAGVAGLIKTVQALRHRQIPPSLHVETPHPEIDFESTPFFANSELRDWSGDGPRRAGVSSFGIGGTNAHVVVEEAPAPEASGPSRPWQLLLLSARTRTALDAVTERLAGHLEEHTEESLADVAHTLRAGRRRFEHRRALVCRDREDAFQALADRDPERLLTVAQEARDRPVAFLFTGQGAQYAGMTRGLYDGEPVFRRWLDAAAEGLEPHLGLDLRQVLYPSSEETDAASERLAQTALTQPALYAVEHALARVWMEWGVTPAAMLGHSVGEYVAATLAGVLSFDDALALVAARGRLMQSCPEGAMLAVPLTGEEIEPVLGEELSLAAINGPRAHVVAGSPDAVSALAEELSSRGVEARRLRTSHAFHSASMDSILDDFAAQVRQVSLNPPEIPFLSGVTGTWIGDDEAADADYWVRQLRETVRFGDGLTRLFEEPARVLLEVGPGRTLAGFARGRDDRPRQQTVVESVRHPTDESDDQAFLLRALGRLWLAGVRPDWDAFAGNERRRRVGLPTYPFERQRFWLDAKAGAQVAPTTAVAAEPVGTTEAAEESAIAGHQRPDLETEHVAPRNATEEKLAVIWQETLAVEDIGVYDDFFELGGHSLLATQISDRTRRTFRVTVPLVELFTKPTIAAMAGVVDEALASGAETQEIEQLPVAVIDREKRHEPFPLTDVQQAYWIGRSSAFELGGVATHVYSEFDVHGIDPEAMTVAWQRLVDRHDMLRAIVRPDGSQQILEEVPPYEIEMLDLTGQPSEQARAALEEVRQTMSQQVLPADQWPLFELRTTRLDDRTRIHISFDMLIGDAWSWEILTWEFGKLYQDPTFELPPLELSFRDYVLSAQELESSPAFDRDLAYWRARLPDFPGAPELPLAKSPMSVGKPRFERLATSLEPPVWSRLKERASAAGLTPSGMLLAAFSEVLSQWSKTPRFVLNLTLFNRLPLHREVGSLIGDFTSLTLLEADYSRLDEPFMDRAQRLQAQLWEDLDHRLVSAVRVLRELARAHGSPARAMMPVVFTSTLNMSRNEAQGESAPAADGDEAAYGISQTPQVWIDHQVNEQGGSLFYNWDVVKDLFPDGLLENMFGAYTQLLKRLADDDDAWSEARPRLVPPAQLAMRRAVADTGGPIPEDLLHGGFIAQARSRAEQPAVISGERTLTYDEVARRAHALAGRLRELGASPNRLVAVSMSKGWEQVVAVLGVLEAGAAYLPIDPELPEKRRFYLLDNGEVEIVLTQARLDEELAWPDGVERLAVDRLEPAEGDFTHLEPVQNQDDLAYVIFTSGSTGEPKGVMIDHRGAVNTVADVNDRFNLGPEDRVLAVSSLSFDLSVWDIFGTLSAGGAIVMPPPAEVPEPAVWSRLLIEHGVTVWNSVPALMELLVDYAGGRPEAVAESLRLVMMSGDWIPVSLPDRLRQLRPEVEQISMGGATEASIWSILYPIAEVGEDWTSIPYGRAMRNQSFHVLDHRLEPRPVWVPGELYIGGIGLAQGYWRDEEKTNDRFIVHPRTGERLYRTGDLGRFLPDGDIQFLGREDFQVKVRGYRIELGEIESALAEHSGIREAVVTAPPIAAAAGGQPGPPGGKRLVAYFIADGDAPEADELRAHLRERLPDYMVPSHFIVLEGWPLTPNGKVDRGQLPAPGDEAAAAARPFAPPETETEEVLVEICSKVLGVEKLSVHDDFFELGGDSLMATRVIFEIRKAFEVELPVLSFFDSPTVAQLAEQVEDMILAEIESLDEEEVHELL